MLLARSTSTTRTASLLALLLLLGCGGGRANPASDGMAELRAWYSKVAPGHQPPPAWVFCLPQSRDTIYGLGFSLQNMAGEEATQTKAFDSAVYNLTRSIKVSVKARKYQQSELAGLTLNDQLLIEKEETIDGQVAQAVREKAGLVSAWKDMSNGVTWVLAAVSTSAISDLQDGQHAAQQCALGQRPQWLQNPPAEKSVLYGIGEARMHWNPAESYKEAERLALVQISEQIKAQVTSFDDRKDTEYEDYSYRIVRIATESELSGSDIVARWVDFRTGVAYALARMPLLSVKRQILSAAKQVAEEDKAKATEAETEDREQSAAEIERKADAALEMMDRALNKQAGALVSPPAATPERPAPEPETPSAPEADPEEATDGGQS